MLCKDIMTKKIIKTYKESTIQEASEIMAKNSIGFLPIVYKDTDIIAGIVTDRDIITRCVARGLSTSKLISDIMTPETISVKETDDISIAISKMADYQIHRILVTNSSTQLTGIITIKDLAIHNDTNKYLNELMREICIPNPQVNKPQEFLKCEDFPL